MSGRARDCCGHRDAWHVDMLDGTEKCAGCDCTTPTGTVVEDVPEHDLTSSEVALARVLRAWVEWIPAPDEEADEAGDMLGRVTEALDNAGLLRAARAGEGPFDQPSDTAAVLLARARKAGVV